MSAIRAAEQAVTKDSLCRLPPRLPPMRKLPTPGRCRSLPPLCFAAAGCWLRLALLAAAAAPCAGWWLVAAAAGADGCCCWRWLLVMCADPSGRNRRPSCGPPPMTPVRLELVDGPENNARAGSLQRRACGIVGAGYSNWTSVPLDNGHRCAPLTRHEARTTNSISWFGAVPNEEGLRPRGVAGPPRRAGTRGRSNTPQL